MKSVVFWIFVGAITLASVNGEEIENTPCSEVISGESSKVTVDPCPEAAEGEPCVLYTNSSATVTITFTPAFNSAPNKRSNKLISSISWVKDVDMAFRGMRSDACSYMPCPLRTNQETKFSATLDLSADLLTGTYPLKVKIQEQRRDKRIAACQLFTIKLERQPVAEEQQPEEEA